MKKLLFLISSIVLFSSCFGRLHIRETTMTVIEIRKHPDSTKPHKHYIVTLTGNAERNGSIMTEIEIYTDSLYKIGDIVQIK